MTESARVNGEPARRKQGWLHIRDVLVRFIASRSGVVLLAYVAASAALTTGVGYRFYQSSLEIIPFTEGGGKGHCVTPGRCLRHELREPALGVRTKLACPGNLPGALHRKLQQTGWLRQQVPPALGWPRRTTHRHAAGRCRDGENDRVVRRDGRAQAPDHAESHRGRSRAANRLSLAGARAELRQLPQSAAGRDGAVAAQRRHGRLCNRRAGDLLPRGHPGPELSRGAQPLHGTRRHRATGCDFSFPACRRARGSGRRAAHAEHAVQDGPGQHGRGPVHVRCAAAPRRLQ